MGVLLFLVGIVLIIMGSSKLSEAKKLKDKTSALESKVKEYSQELNARETFISEKEKNISKLNKIIYAFLTIFLYLLKCPQSLILSALRAFCFCGKPHISRSIFLYFRYQAWLKSW